MRKTVQNNSGFFQFFSFMGNFYLFLLALLFNILEGLCLIILASYTGKITNCVMNNDRAQLIDFFVWSLFYAAALMLCIVIKEFFYATYLENGIKKIKKRTFFGLLWTTQSFIDNVHNAEVTANVSNDINALSSALRPFVIMCFSQIINRVIAIGYLFFVNPFLTAVILCCVPPITFLQWKITKSVKEIQKNSMEHMGKMVSVASDCFSSREVIKAMCLESEFYKQFVSAQDKQYNVDIKSKWIVSVSGAFGLISVMLPLMITGLVSGLLILNGKMTVGTMMVFVTLSYSASQILSGLSDFFNKGQTFMACAERVMRLWNIPQQSGGQTEDKVNYLSLPDISSGAMVCFDQVNFSYDDKKILSDCCLDIYPGEVICLSGQSGSGKSTILKLICNLYQPQSGKILIDGVNVNQYEPEALHSMIIYITQESFLFSASVYENVACFDESISRKKVLEILSLLGLGEKIASLPKGLDSPVGDHGSMLSGGERQRVAIARAILRKARIILLDEIASGLDTLSEKEILKQFLDLPYKPTVIFITHRETNGLDVDRYVEVKDICGTEEVKI